MVKLEDVLKNFDQRLSAIESQLRHMEKPISRSEASPRSAEKLDKGPAPTAPVSYKTQRPAENNPSFDSSSVLAFIGIVFVILAGVFFIKITIESGWLTPVRQIMLATGTGLIFFMAPQFFPKTEREYGALLAGAGTTILHLTWLGAYFFHHILDAHSALVCATLVGFFSIFANFDKGNRVYVLVAMAGTYLSAPIIGYNTGELSILSIFLIIWNISFSAAALMNKRRDILFIASYYAVFTVLLLSGNRLTPEQQSELLILQLVQFLIFSTAMLWYSGYHKKPMSSEESIAIFPLLLLFYFSTGHLIKIISPELAPWFGIAIGASVLGIYFFARTFLSAELKTGPTLTSFAAMAFVHSFYFQLLDESWQPLAALVIGIAVLGIYSQSLTARKDFFWPLIILFSTFAYGAILTIVSVREIDSIYLYNWAYGALALFVMIKITSIKDLPPEANRYWPLLLGFGHLEVLLGLYRFSQKISWSGALFVTFSWGIYAGLILAIAYWRRDKTLGHSALTILLAVSLKAFFYDVSNTSNLIRVVCLLAEGLLLYGCGWIFKKMQEWENPVIEKK